MTNFLGQKVSFPSHEAAYKYLLETSGISQKERENALAEAEIRGQQSLEQSLSRRDTSPETLGNAGMGDPNQGQEITEEVAKEIAGVPGFEGRNTIDEEKMETLIRMNQPKGWEMLDQLRRAERRLKLPITQDESDWPTRPDTAQ